MLLCSVYELILLIIRISNTAAGTRCLGYYTLYLHFRTVLVRENVDTNLSSIIKLVVYVPIFILIAKINLF
jgi:hypothetical protein